MINQSEQESQQQEHRKKEPLNDVIDDAIYFLQRAKAAEIDRSKKYYLWQASMTVESAMSNLDNK